MTKISKAQLERLHRSAATLSRAWILYAPSDLQVQWKNLQQKSVGNVIEKDVKAAASMDGGWEEKFAQAFSGGQAILAARGDLERKLKANILIYIKQGHLHGFGYELPRTVSSIPVAIPKEAWGGRCDWHKCTLSYRGLEFVDVRLTTNRKGARGFTAHTGDHGAVWLFQDPDDPIPNNPPITIDFRAFGLATGGLHAAEDHFRACMAALAIP